jgi:hypothetical protein
MTSRSTGSASRQLLAIAVLLAVFGGEAWARKRVAVAPFSGPKADAIHDAVEALVESDNTLISASAYRRARAKVPGRRLNDAAVARIAADLQIDALIEGVVERRRGSYSLLVTVRDGQTGAVSDELSVRLRGPRLDERSKGDLTDGLLPALAKVGGLGEEPVDITPMAPPEAESENPLETAPPVAEAAPTEVVEGHPDSEEWSAQRHNRHAAVDVQVGMTGGWRNLRFTFAPDLQASKKPHGYKGGLVPSVLLVGEVYPLAFAARRSALTGLGVSFVFDRALLLKSKLGDTEYDTSQMRFGAGLRYRFPFGNKATLPTLKAIAGWNSLSFKIDRGAMDIDLPNVSYSYIDAGLAARLPLGNPSYAVYADFRYMIVLGAGEIQEQAFYGDGSILGIDGDIGVELIFAKRVIVKVGGRYQRIAFDFDGTGTKSNDRDDDLMTQDVGGALDQYFSAYATAGYLF